MTNILVTAPFTEEGLAALRAHGNVVHKPWNVQGRPHTDEELTELIEANSSDVLVVEIDPVSRELMQRTGLKAVGCCRAGLPNIDLEAARELGIRVLRTPGRNAQAVAEYVLGTILTHLRNIPAALHFARSGEWTPDGERPYLRFRGNELAERTVVLHGFGAVGRKVTELLRPFHCTVLAIDPYVDPATLPEGVRLVEAEEGYAAADVLSIHLPVTDVTKGAVNRELLELLPGDAIVVNSARAAVMDYEALTDLLRSGRIAGAVLDVYREEPVGQLDAELIALPNVTATPHIAGATHEVVDHHSRMMADALGLLLAGKEPDPGFVAV